MVKNFNKTFLKYSKKFFNNSVTGNETWVYCFEANGKCSNRLWATKNAAHPSFAKRQCTIKKVLYEIFFANKGPVMQLPVLKGRTVTGALYKNVVLKSWRHTSRDASLK